MNTPSRTPGDRDRALRVVRRLRVAAALMGTAAVGAFTGFSAINHAASTVASTSTTTSTSTTQTGSNTASTTTPTAGASLSTPTTAPTAAPATAAPVTVSGGSSG